MTIMKHRVRSLRLHCFLCEIPRTVTFVKKAVFRRLLLPSKAYQDYALVESGLLPSDCVPGCYSSLLTYGELLIKDGWRTLNSRDESHVDVRKK
jgi:hypothetical protein